MDLKLEQKTVFIAGCSQGIGLGIAKGFLSEGANIVMTARTPSKLEAVVKSLEDDVGPNRIAHFAGDMTDTEQIEAALQYGEKVFGDIDIAIANVGIDNTPLGFDITDEQWESGVQQNLHSAFRLARAALRRFQAREEGNLIFISSITGTTAFGSPINYGTSKSAVNHLTRELARHVGRHNVRVNCICPGNIIFPGGNWEKQIEADAERWTRWIRREVALKRFGQMEEIADACLWLSSERSSFVTGTVIPVDGGQSAT